MKSLLNAFSKREGKGSRSLGACGARCALPTGWEGGGVGGARSSRYCWSLTPCEGVAAPLGGLCPSSRPLARAAGVFLSVSPSPAGPHSRACAGRRPGCTGDKVPGTSGKFGLRAARCPQVGEPGTGRPGRAGHGGSRRQCGRAGGRFVGARDASFLSGTKRVLRAGKRREAPPGRLRRLPPFGGWESLPDGKAGV